MEEKFTWVETHKGIVKFLKTQKDNQKGLIQLLKDSGVEGFDDEMPKGNRIELDEIDPFTFFCYIYKYGDRRRLEILQNIADKLNLERPADTLGLPSTNALKVWLFSYKFDRIGDEIKKLWNFFDLITSKENTISNEIFAQILEIRNVGKIKITEVLFYILPEIFFPIDGPSIPYLVRELGISTHFNTFSEYNEILSSIKKKTNAPFFELSYLAYIWNEEQKKSRKFWRIGTKDDDNSYWDLMYSNGFGSIGWANLGDLSSTNINNKTDIINLLLNKEYYIGWNQVRSRKAGEIFNFIRDIKIGDIVLAQDGQTIRGIGIVESNYYFDSSFKFSHQRKINWIIKDPPFINKQGNQTSVYLIDNPYIIKEIEDCIFTVTKEEEEAVAKNNVKYNSVTNKIIYGSPGTGKTYSLINKSLEIIGHDTENKERIELKEKFSDYINSGQIVFTTFHQSMSYEDFIEGIKPITAEGEVTYEVQNGIFKKIAIDAAFEFVDKEKYDIENLNEKEKIKIEAIKKIDWKEIDENRIKNTLPYVLIIDEINRGNVSAIFGELITLIEDSKRLGKDEALTVTLPYSKEPFGVPPNLYIIGTMNTADRSVEALDTALRRRFVFEEMMPDYELLTGKNIDNISLKTILETINNRIEVLLSRDHLIGHSYFLEVDSWEKLNETFYKNIIPLLQEYFYGDYGKIGLVLGSGFVKKKNMATPFAKIEGYDYDFERNFFEIIKNDSTTIKNAISQLLNINDNAQG